ncbi:hypothetical protein JQC92_19950 [Shewanella sp. 202IG2-18]|uniref:hypothetical protein n=1 Tax=Parashewanella hymeniacidonis TaxID=2807618 RepID=UPI001961F947|nr:hypothetical protein [Parashewanella hymeniacidonis]MBM7074270.1 hypothetical protein [Parashewanella hymeniacidonis]
MRFQYQVDQDIVELKASNWFGMEELFLNGQSVKKVFNFSPSSDHKIKLSNGHNCRFQMFVDPTHNNVVCRVYKKDQLLARLTQNQNKQDTVNRIVNCALIAIGLGFIALFSLQI